MWTVYQKLDSVKKKKKRLFKPTNGLFFAQIRQAYIYIMWMNEMNGWRKKDQISRLTLTGIFNFTASCIIICSNKFIKAMDQRQFKLKSPENNVLLLKCQLPCARWSPLLTIPSSWNSRPQYCLILTKQRASLNYRRDPDILKFSRDHPPC